MRRATITIGDEISAQLDSWIRQQDAAPSLTAVVQAALKEFLAQRGFAAPPRKLQIERSGAGTHLVRPRRNRFSYSAGPDTLHLSDT
ncbi:MAG: hypothetical protein JNN08_00350 [Bryobacterales bacterium]|nr:hypothetical protein [Bryobacterales bacterium]